MKLEYADVKRTISKGVKEFPIEPPIVPLIPEIDEINVIYITLSYKIT